MSYIPDKYSSIYYNTFSSAASGQMACDAQGNIWYPIPENKIGKMTPNGFVQEFPTISEVDAVCIDNNNLVWYVSINGNILGKIALDGTGNVEYPTTNPTNPCLSFNPSDERIYVCDFSNSAAVMAFDASGNETDYLIPEYGTYNCTGSDNRTWIAGGGAVLYAVDTLGNVSSYSTGTDTTTVSPGAPGYVYYTTTLGTVGIMPISGASYNEYSTPFTISGNLALGGDGNMYGGIGGDFNGICSIFPNGDSIVYGVLLPSGSQINAVVAGITGDIYGLSSSGNAITRFFLN